MIEKAELRPSLKTNQMSQELTLGQFLQDAKTGGRFDGLTQIERDVLEKHWLNGQSLQEIAPKIGVTSKERVRQIEAEAFRKILAQISDEKQKAATYKLLENKRQDPEHRQRMVEGQRRRRQREKAAKVKSLTI